LPNCAATSGQAAEELGQGKTGGEERRPLVASPAAIKPAARHGEPAEAFPANAVAADGDHGWMA
jgi:hypothetical protein